MDESVEIKPGWGETRGGELVLVTPICGDFTYKYKVTTKKGASWSVTKHGFFHSDGELNNVDVIRNIPGPEWPELPKEEPSVEEFRQRMAEEIEDLRNEVMQLTSSLLIRVQDFGRVGD